MIQYLGFAKGDYPEVLKIANELGEIEKRAPHDSIKMLIEEAGQEKINCLKEERRK